MKYSYDDFRRRMNQVADLRFANAVLQWDQETYLPVKGAAFRGQQISTLSELSHQLFTEPSLLALIDELLAGELTAGQKRNLELTKEDIEKQKKYSSAFVRKMSEQVNRTFHAWIEARKQNNFQVYAPELERLIQLKKEESEILGYREHPYDAHLNEYEKGSTVSQIDPLFSDLLPSLKKLLDRIAAKPQVDDSFLKGHFAKQTQWDWGMYLIRQLHFDFEAGRQDISEHPFSISFAPTDVRITTRIDENDFGNMTWSCIHETGHALYEQGLPESEYGLPLGEACSYSMHESQSRLWENNVGRGRAFWQHYYPQLQQYFPGAFGSLDLDSFYKGINKVQPSLIRTEADEITYHFHVYIRYELEKKLIEGSLATADIPSYWNSQYKHWLGVDVPSDREGCLQDVHWSHGSFGYFPTYSLGSFYAAQFYRTADLKIKSLEDQIAKGETQSLLNWLRKEIHAYGRAELSEDLCERVTGQRLQVGFFLDYLLHKYSEIYTL